METAMKKSEIVTAASVINQLCLELNYTRPHIINLMKTNRRALRASKRGRRWMMPAESVAVLRQLVRDTSGRRYKLGENGPHQ
jgi:hypothetical protein